MDLSLSTETVGDRTVIRVGGEIDEDTAPKLREQFVELVNDGSYNLVVDLERVDSIEDAGIDALLGGQKLVREQGGSMRLVCNQERILKIFRTRGLTKVISIHTTVEDAVQATD
ncbi:STAS domain-containing protein [Nocardia sp. CA-128927]|uniref:STAS domain-containing protein n=1 Tax=Nocardia sp. CA-128927 TaxID=3239975 RepID=UPI003D95DD63